MNSIIIKSLRILSILSLMLGGSWLAQHYSVNYARADISPELLTPLQLPAELQSLALRFSLEGGQNTMVNGQPFQTRIGRWSGSPRSLQRALQQQITASSPTPSTQYFTQSGEGWFIAGKLPTPGIISSQGYMIRAEQQKNSTRVWLWTYLDSGPVENQPFVVMDLLPVANAERLFSSSNHSPGRKNWISGYSAPGTVEAHRRHYSKQLKNAGYIQAATVATDKNAAQLLSFYNNTSEISILVSPSTDNPELSIDIVQFRQHE